ncbi:MAG: glutamine-hydrolyzing carbamoyl-phosphate synthase small subunit [Candidatus Moranbacteria bacterium]|nr:glutamine-hydrolyzing carbamoyl-phosphate synthase small subunit [Candidatus Moranbacteria bacterium]
MKKAQLVLEDGSRFEGFSFGSSRENDGEVVFNTGMVGYNESLTDPSYSGQILVFTYPLIGNYGVPGDKKIQGISTVFESSRAHVRGLIVSQYCQNYSHWKAKSSLGDFLKSQKIPAITGIDTRALTKKLRQKGVMLGKILIKNYGKKFSSLNFHDPNERDLVKQVCAKKVTGYFGSGSLKNAKTSVKKILFLDCGAKNNIFHSFLKYKVQIIRVPKDYNIKNQDFDGLFISNGPGDPEKNPQTIKSVKWAIEKNKPVFGICLGQQIMGLAAGAKKFKLKYGHRSQNQPCIELGTNRCYLTSQNHGFCVDKKSLKKDWEPWFVNANDGTLEGIKHKSQRFFAVQFHPEATPGPNDTNWLIKKFVDIL